MSKICRGRQLSFNEISGKYLCRSSFFMKVQLPTLLRYGLEFFLIFECTYFKETILNFQGGME